MKLLIISTEHTEGATSFTQKEVQITVIGPNLFDTVSIEVDQVILDKRLKGNLRQAAKRVALASVGSDPSKLRYA